MDNITNKEDFIVGCIQNRVIYFEPTKWLTGIEPYSFNGRAIYSYPSLFNYVVEDMAKQIESKDIKSVCGIETASLPLSGALGLRTDRKSIYMRKKAHDYGTYQLIEGHEDKDEPTVVVDDISITYEIHHDLMKPIWQANLNVVGMMVVFEKMIPTLCRNKFEDQNIWFYSTFTYEDLAKVIENQAEELGIEKKYSDIVRTFADYKE